MPPQQRTPPIDKAISKAYLREFSGWSTAYPPGISDPTTLRSMDNVSISREGAVEVRPGMERLTNGANAISALEPFYHPTWGRVFLFAYRITSGVNSGMVGFRVLRPTAPPGLWEIHEATDVLDWDGLVPNVELSAATNYVKFLQIDNKIYALSDSSDGAIVFYVGEEQKISAPLELTYPQWNKESAPSIYMPTQAWIDGPQTTKPPEATPTDTSLISSDASKNVWNIGYFYTASNEFGESAASMITTVRVQRPPSRWRVAASGVDNKAPDQLVIDSIGSFSNWWWSRALRWNVYMIAWSDQANVPTEAVLLKSRDIARGNNPELAYNNTGWMTHTPFLQGTGQTSFLPSEENRYNYSVPPTGSNGLVAGDRMFIVNDADNPAVIRWTSNALGRYSDFSASLGGGYKTLSSGNLYIPVNVQLWQNPQSVDTVTVLCSGKDGRSTAYYAAPAETSGNTNSARLIAWEETTATPGTCSPYGVEVLNNALYHPTDMELMKSTATNYNIAHKSMTDEIQNKWAAAKKEWIISTQLERRLYYIVRTDDTSPNEKGNEIWVCDTVPEGGVWYRWTIPASSFSVIEDQVRWPGAPVLVVLHGGEFYAMREGRGYDDRPDQLNPALNQQVPIEWSFETNTQGANRAHDAWCVLQQVNITLGDFDGAIEYGIRGKDVHGRWVEVKKTYCTPDLKAPTSEPYPSDLQDFLLVEKGLMEWRFFANNGYSAEGDIDKAFTTGKLNLIQYRYTPLSVNVGYAYGSVETFEYQRNRNWTARQYTVPPITENGVPLPFSDRELP